MYSEEEERIFEEQRRKAAQFFIDDYDNITSILDGLIEVTDGTEKEKLIESRERMEKNIKDLYPIAEGRNKKGR